MKDETVYFDGDPATESSRRHMERVLRGDAPPKWPWLLAAVASGGLFALWRTASQAQPAKRQPDRPAVDRLPTDR